MLLFFLTIQIMYSPANRIFPFSKWGGGGTILIMCTQCTLQHFLHAMYFRCYNNYMIEENDKLCFIFSHLIFYCYLFFKIVFKKIDFYFDGLLWYLYISVCIWYEYGFTQIKRWNAHKVTLRAGLGMLFVCFCPHWDVKHASVCVW